MLNEPRNGNYLLKIAISAVSRVFASSPITTTVSCVKSRNGALLKGDIAALRELLICANDC
jgi:hypothetical protein